ncbi:hypothetical protein D910_12590 [Dendroctonus ponderosae]|uniref:DUF4794 domain-containing protein n=1 Tax=Dendroctonus ponderosae TaxID=77166 RepID=U4UMM3_DENPD|nr:hypothetical protein D910_12590 [Dendroctonus ponderosae]
MSSKLVLLGVFAFLSACVAEPPKWRSSARFSRFQRIEAAPEAHPPVPHTEYGPPPAPSSTSSAPSPSYGPPSPSYGPPPEISLTTTTETAETTTDLPTTTEPLSESVAAENKTSKLQQPTGSYYIYHPSGVLQKVSYISNNDEHKMSFDVKLKYENVDPIRGPVYTYDPQTQVLQRIVGQI